MDEGLGPKCIVCARKLTFTKLPTVERRVPDVASSVRAMGCYEVREVRARLVGESRDAGSRKSAR